MYMERRRRKKDEKNKEICRLCAGGVYGRKFAGKRSSRDGVGG